MKRPFSLFDWNRPFLQDIYAYLRQNTEDLRQHSLLILPHKRPRRYILDMLKKDTTLSRPVLVPRMLTVAEFVQCVRPHSSGLRSASHLDRIHLLHACVRKAAHEDEGDEGSGAFDMSIRQQFSSMSLAHFLPWGTRLASLFEEYMVQDIPVQNMQHTEGDVSDKAAALLSALKRIHNHYVAALHERAWTTPGLDAAVAAQYVREHVMTGSVTGSATGTSAVSPRQGAAFPYMVCPSAERHVFIVGFSAPTRTEHILFKELWHRGAHVCLHTDAASATATQVKDVHWSCADHVRWMLEWKAQGQLVTQAKGYVKPVYHFVAGYDLHSQLQEVETLLRTDDNAQSTALVLTNPDALMPMLHHVPRTRQGGAGEAEEVMEFNISMGYPLNKSPLMTLLDAIFRMQTTARTRAHGQEGERVYYWRHLLHCVQHPYITMLTAQSRSTSSDSAPSDTALSDAALSTQGYDMRPLLNILERHLRQGQAYVEPVQLVDTILAGTDTPPTAAALLQNIIHCLVTRCATPVTTNEMGDALLSLCHMLLDAGQDVWKRYPLDAEALYRLIKHCIPALKSSSLAHETLPQETLFSITQELMAQERVPFEADPLTGLQILGMLETRLLHFERVIFVDATDDVLPGFSAQDPLLPDALRATIGLPSSQTRERLMAHTFYRLMASAKAVHFFWQESEGVLLEQKKVRSRFVDACLWKEEQALGEIIKKGDDGLKATDCPLRPVVTRPRCLVRTEGIQERVRAMMARGLSPTQLDMYMRCPQRFAWHYVYGLHPLDSAREGEDIPAIGNLLHKIMEQLYDPYKGKNIHTEWLTPDIVQQARKECLAASALEETLPADSFVMLDLISPRRLHTYLEHQPRMTHVVALEASLEAPLHISDTAPTYTLRGKADRIDKRIFDETRTEQLLVLDYKTGSIPAHSFTAWEDDALFERMTQWEPVAGDEAATDDILMTVAEAFTSAQLPAYMFMAQYKYSTDMVADAAWVDLGDTGKEIPFMGDAVGADVRRHILQERVPQFLAFLVRHMHSATHFGAYQSKQCTYCPFATLCVL